MNRIEDLNDLLTSKEEQIRTLEEFQWEWRERVKAVSEENAVLSERALRINGEIQQLRQKLSRRTEGFVVVFLLVLLSFFLSLWMPLTALLQFYAVTVPNRCGM